ncbi:pilus assembly protein [Arenicella xantha]|uniref:PilC-like protein with beta-propeller domain n=1 Tax=Arenicella xantha TaxID=644221 RepID=A0A395JQE3_9GAMM|nr:PilC/PilY family type IV pilus protein [Arenicella xantha]RBP52656.1 PilC-like protein with beta-propeller domain [Arenicella xantha]
MKNTKTIQCLLDRKRLMGFQRNTIVSAFACIFTLASGTGQAEDIEIYTGVVSGGTGAIQTNPDFFPNVLFILDNSTSMGETEPNLVGYIDESPDTGGGGCNVDLSSYDPSFDYSFGVTPNDSNIYIYKDGASGDNYSGKYVTEAQNHCQAYRDEFNSATSNYPVFRDKLVQFGFRSGSNTEYGWDDDIDNLDTDPVSGVECQDDNRDHGHNTVNTYTNDRPRNTNGAEDNSTMTAHYFSRNSGDGVYRDTENVYWVASNYHQYLQLTSGNTLPPESCSKDGTAKVRGYKLAKLGAEDEPVEVDYKAQACGGNSKDRDADTGYSQYKNMYFKVQDDADPDLYAVYKCITRLESMKTALKNSLADTSKVNAGLMRFNENSSSARSGGTVAKAVSNMNVDANKTALLNEVEAIEFGKFTPLAESMYEAYLYWAGKNIEYGHKTLKGSYGEHATFNVDWEDKATYDRTEYITDPDAIDPTNSTKYKSPITSQCQANSIVMLSDGDPTNDNNANLKVKDVIGSACSTCADELSLYMANHDLSDLPGVIAEVNTYTIGFNLSSSYLASIANNGRPDDALPNSGYFEATDLQGLESVFRSILDGISNADSDVFSAPAVTVNAFNRLQNKEDIYYALFKPENNSRWDGNVKKYKVTADAKIVDANSQTAIGSDGFFHEDAQSYWSTSPDGGEVSDGGAGEHIQPARKLFGNVDGSTIVSLSGADQVAAVEQFLEQTARRPAGDAIPSIDIGARGGDPSAIDANQVAIASWTLGYDVDNELGNGATLTNQYIGESLHGVPYVLSFGATEANPNDIVFYTSNQGMLHAINGADGTEAWSYVPDRSLFSNLGNYYNKDNNGKTYGLDSEIAFLVRRDASSAVSRAHLFFGQRRGGNKLFAVDVSDATDVANPVSKLWTIEGGSGDYARLGQTWAEPVVTKANYCEAGVGGGAEVCGLRDVLFVSGGYDEQYDTPTASLSSLSNNVLGNSVYMIDAATGELLWMVGKTVVNSTRDLTIPEMTHSVVSKPTVLDVNKDGAADMLFFTDIAGQVFRVDFRAAAQDENDISASDNSQNDSVKDADGTTNVTIDDVAGGLIADLQVSGVNRRFYNPVDVTLLPEVRADDGTLVASARYALVTGTGYRASPLTTEGFSNQFYVLYDKNVTQPLYDEEVSPSSDSDSVKEAVYTYVEGSSVWGKIGASDLGSAFQAGGNGYSITINGVGEKFINPTLISDFKAIAVSYLPADNNAANLGDSCNAGLGTSKAYAFNLLNGGVEVTELEKPGITATPVVIYVLDTITVMVDGVATQQEVLKPIVIIGTEPFDGETQFGLSNLNLGKADKKVWWEDGRAR